MTLLHTLGGDVLAANIESRKAHHDLRTNVNKIGVLRGTDAKKSAPAKKASAKKSESTDKSE